MKKTIIGLTLIFFLIPTAGRAVAPTTTAAAAVVMDAATGEVLYSHNAESVRSAASITKLMTAMIFIEQKPRWGMRVRMQKSDEVGGGRLRFPVGTVITARDAFYAALVGSANNSATMLRRISGLSWDRFLHEMNVRAATIGMTSTHFVDTSGISPDNTTTALDIARLARYAFDNPTIRRAAVTSRYPIGKRTITNTNRLLTTDPDIYITGGKTGYLDEAGYNLVIQAKNSDGRQVIVALLGAPTRTVSFDETKSLAHWAFEYGRKQIAATLP